MRTATAAPTGRSGARSPTLVSYTQAVYRRILDEIVAGDHAVLASRVVVPTHRRPALAAPGPALSLVRSLPFGGTR